MTTVNTEHLARGWALIAEGAQYLSMAYASMSPPVPARETGVSASAPTAGAAEGAQAASPPPSSVAPDFDELPPDGWHETVTDDHGAPVLKPQVEAGLGKCPVHGKPWTVKPAGVGKKGPYDAFYKCAERDGDEWCALKPQKIWRDIHPLPTSAAA